MNQIRKFVTKRQGKSSTQERCVLVNSFTERDQRFLQELADSLHLHTTWDETDEYGQPQVALSFNVEGVSTTEDQTEDAAGIEEDEGEWQSDTEADEGDVAAQRVFAKYDKAKVVSNTVEDFEDHYEDKIKEKMDEWKREYYRVGRSVRDPH